MLEDKGLPVNLSLGINQKNEIMSTNSWDDL